MKSLKDLWRELANELAGWCHTSAAEDINTVFSRIEAEGFSFLTITLPQFGKDLERALDRGRVDDDLFLGFKKRGGLPVFMQGFLRQIFDPRDCCVRQQPSIDCIFAVRQLCYLYQKISLPCSNSRVVSAMESYVECESELRTWECNVETELIEEFYLASQALCANVFSVVDSDIYHGDVNPRHGPGSTADGLVGNDKFNLRQWTQRLERIFPYGEYVLPNWRYFRLLNHVDFREPGAEQPAEVIAVPKTLKGPRIIVREPTCMQYMQQAISRALYREIEDPNLREGSGRNFLSHFIGFTDQIPNQEMAREGSQSGQLATLDMSEASDRVPHLLVTVMLRNFPWLRAAVNATRSTRVEIPQLGISLPQLTKFASMGSALTFPMEALVFCTAVFMGIARAHGTRVRDLHFEDYVGKVRVYGDDLIVPVDCVDSVIQTLELLGFKVNKDKSFWNGKFRESCGGDFYDGTDITPVRCRKEFPSSRKNGSSVASLVEFRNHLYMRGLWNSTSWLDEKISKILGGFFPIIEPTSPGLGRHSVLPYQGEREDDDTHAPRVRAYVPQPRIPKNSLEGSVGALVKCLSSPIMFEDERHLDRSGRASVVDIKLRWVTPF